MEEQNKEQLLIQLKELLDLMPTSKFDISEIITKLEEEKNNLTISLENSSEKFIGNPEID